MVLKIVLVLLALHVGWWVVRGYHIPPILVAGPYQSSGDCLSVAQDINRIQMSFEYHSSDGSAVNPA